MLLRSDSTPETKGAKEKKEKIRREGMKGQTGGKDGQTGDCVHVDMLQKVVLAYII